MNSTQSISRLFALALVPLFVGAMLFGMRPQAVAASGAAIIINEFQYDPVFDDMDPTAGDANGDGERDGSEDEFVELVNVSGSPLDIGDWTISDAVGLRHTFPAGTILETGCAIVVFGGGTPSGAFGGAVVQTSSEGFLGLNNSGDTITLADDMANMMGEVVYDGSVGSDQSATLDPDLTGGAYVDHSTATGSGGELFSPGTLIDGSAFATGCTIDTPPAVDSTVPTDGAVNVDVTSDITINFTENITFTMGAVMIEDSSGMVAFAPVGSTSDVASVVLDPSADLALGELHTVTVKAANVADSAMQNMAADYVFTFTTDDGMSEVCAANLIINEVDADTVDEAMGEFVELYDGGVGNTALDGCVLVLYNGSDDQSYDAVDLDGLTTPGDGFFVICDDMAAVANCDFEVSTWTSGSGNIQNGADAVTLFGGSDTDFPNDTPITTSGLVSVIVYGTNDSDDPGLLMGFGESVQADESENFMNSTESTQRVQMAPRDPGEAYFAGTPTPGAMNGTTTAVSMSNISTSSATFTVTLLVVFVALIGATKVVTKRD